MLNKHTYCKSSSFWERKFSLNPWLRIRPAFLTFLLLIAFTNKLQAQENLIYNGDFEMYSSCPTDASDPTQNPKQIERCIGWKAPTYGTSDYFNICTTSPTISIPDNIPGYQWPYNGNGYLGGFFTCYTDYGSTDGSSGHTWWEYVQGQLTTSLESGKVYRFSMEVSMAECSDLMIKEIGAYFSDTPITTANTKPLSFSPQCVFTSENYYSDTVNWIHLETLYQATGTEKYITIGNFKDSITTDTLRRYNWEPFAANPFFTYFYIDNVQLVDYTWEKEPTNVFTPNGDGLNDLWTLPYSDQKNFKTVTIMNRWGNLIKEGNLNGFSWDGKTQNGEDCSDGSYFFRISNTNIAGFIQLIR